MKVAISAVIAAALLTACGQGEVNPPNEPAAPSEPPEAEVPHPPGTGPASFVGVWTADPAWCGNVSGPEQPITITATHFEGYENTCEITRVTQSGDGYEAVLSCTSEGVTSTERTRMSVTGDTLEMTWLDRDSTTVEFTRCPAIPAQSAG